MALVVSSRRVTCAEMRKNFADVSLVSGHFFVIFVFLCGNSRDRLLRMLNRLGQDIEIVVHPKPRSRKHARLHVVSV